jgi:hypothetical protein
MSCARCSCRRGVSLCALYRFAIGDLVKQRHAVGFRPEAYLSGVLEGRIFDLEQLGAVVRRPEAGAHEVDPQAVPTVGWHWNSNAVAPGTPNNVEWATHAVHGLVKDDIVFKRVGADYVIIVRIACPPNETGCAVRRPANSPESDFKEAILDARIVFQEQWKSSLAGLLEHSRL